MTFVSRLNPFLFVEREHNLTVRHHDMLRRSIGGQDSTEIFYGLHKSEVLLRPVYKRLQIGKITGAAEQFAPPAPGALNPIPYAGESQSRGIPWLC